MPSPSTISRHRKTVSLVTSLHLAITSLAAPAISLALVSPAVAQTKIEAVAVADAINAAKASVADALASGERVLLVELHGPTLYVLNTENNVGGPVLRVLEQLGFRPVLPEGIDVGASGVTSLCLHALRRSPADHVFFLNFSTSDNAVREVEEALGPISGGRLYRMGTTTSIALSAEWTEPYLVPLIAEAIRADG
ncbi:hypothetical protein MZK49_10630 [Ensifer sesbaniae]|uniref:hypothetical protein n=1 Tax=Ensifer sesbaniae TaxID=1214071 RepID=UPI0020009659|nr:hypothetical protein [Ensifer sesbaniae]